MPFASTHSAPAPSSSTPAWRWIDRKLARVTSSGDLIPEFEGLRFFGILAVVIYHLTYYVFQARMGAGNSPDWPYMNQHSRVAHVVSVFYIALPFFFVVSGCLLGRPFAAYYLGLTRAAPSLSGYYLRRIGRIEPPYLLALTASFVLLPWARWQSYVAGIFYLHGLVLHSMNSFNPPFWSLECEAMFYAMTPFLAALIFRLRPAWLRRGLVLLAATGLSVFVDRWVIARYGFLEYTIVGSIGFFLGGMLLADLYASGVVVRKNSLMWDAAAVAALALVAYLALRRTAPYSWSIVFLIVLILAAIIQGRIINWIFCLRPLALIGGMCYSIYLWHNLFLIWFSRTIIPRIAALAPSDSWGIVWASAVCIPPIVLASSFLYYWTEKPFMNGPGSRYITRVLRRALGMPASRSSESRVADPAIDAALDAR